MTERFLRIERLESVDSTNRYLVDAARRGEKEGVVAIARTQSAGRGRRGRTWHAEPDTSLLCSVLFTPTIALDRSFLLAGVVALAAREAIIGLEARCDLKWPNDLLIDGRKVAGVLSEIVSPLPSAPYGVVVGIGINCFWSNGKAPLLDDAATEELDRTAITLEQVVGRRVLPGELEETFFRGMTRRYEQLRRDDGRDALVAEYRAACVTIGSDVRVELDAATLVGRATGIDQDGRLLVMTTAGPSVAVEVGDVVHLRDSAPETDER